MGAQGEERLAVRRIEDIDELVPAAGRQTFAVRTVGDTPEPVGGLDVERFLALGDVPYLDGAVQVARRHANARRIEGHTRHLAGRVLRRLIFLFVLALVFFVFTFLFLVLFVFAFLLF